MLARVVLKILFISLNYKYNLFYWIGEAGQRMQKGAEEAGGLTYLWKEGKGGHDMAYHVGEEGASCGPLFAGGGSCLQIWPGVHVGALWMDPCWGRGHGWGVILLQAQVVIMGGCLATSLSLHRAEQ